MKFLIYTLLLVNTISLFSRDNTAIYKAINKLDYGFIDYEFTMIDDQTMGGKRLRRVSEFNPDEELQFNLNNKNGKTPSKREVRSYSKDKTNLFGKDRFLKNSDFTFKDLAMSDSYEFIEEDSGLSRFSFINRNSVIPENSEPLYGELWVDLNSQEITRIYLQNIDPMDIFLGISISNFQLDFEFTPEENSHTLIKDIDCEIVGNVLFFKIDYTSNISMMNYSANS